MDPPALLALLATIAGLVEKAKHFADTGFKVFATPTAQPLHRTRSLTDADRMIQRHKS
jgi:hypothetical protein